MRLVSGGKWGEKDKKIASAEKFKQPPIFGTRFDTPYFNRTSYYFNFLPFGLTIRF